MTDPELHYRLWKQQHGEWICNVARQQEARDGLRPRFDGCQRELRGRPAPTPSSWLRVVVDGFLRRRMETR